MAQTVKSNIILSSDKGSIRVRHIGNNVVFPTLEKFPLSNPSGLGNALNKTKVSQRDVKRLYAWLKTLKSL